MDDKITDLNRPYYYIVNAITAYRLIAAFILIYLIVQKNIDAFKWVLLISFCTDAIDGYLARKYHVSSNFGARLDSIADDLSILAATVAVFIFFPGFIQQQLAPIIALLALYVIQLTISLIKYRKISTFHTYAAKVAALLQGAFLIPFFFMKQPIIPLFYAVIVATMIDLIEETILVLLLPKNQSDVKGLFWVLRDRWTLRR